MLPQLPFKDGDGNIFLLLVGLCYI
jgi:hypothetical protein